MQNSSNPLRQDSPDDGLQLGTKSGAFEVEGSENFGERGNPLRRIRGFTDGPFLSLLVLAAFWWIFTLCKVPWSRELPSPTHDYLGRSCGDGLLRKQPFLYVPLLHQVTALQYHEDLNLTSGICLGKCPLREQELQGITVGDWNPDLSAVYPESVLQTRLYESQPFGNFLCLPVNTSGKRALIHKLHLNSNKVRLWLVTDQIRSNSIFLCWIGIGVSIPMVLGLIYLALVHCVPGLCVLAAGPGLLACILPLISSRSSISLVEPYALRLLDMPSVISGVLILTLLSTSAFMLLALLFYSKRLRLSTVTLNTTYDVIRAVPQLLCLPSATALVVSAIALLAVVTWGPLIIEDGRVSHAATPYYSQRSSALISSQAPIETALQWQSNRHGPWRRLQHSDDFPGSQESSYMNDRLSAVSRTDYHNLLGAIEGEGVEWPDKHNLVGKSVIDDENKEDLERSSTINAKRGELENPNMNDLESEKMERPNVSNEFKREGMERPNINDLKRDESERPNVEIYSKREELEKPNVHVLESVEMERPNVGNELKREGMERLNMNDLKRDEWERPNVGKDLNGEEIERSSMIDLEANRVDNKDIVSINEEGATLHRSEGFERDWNSKSPSQHAKIFPLYAESPVAQRNQAIKPQNLAVKRFPENAPIPPLDFPEHNLYYQHHVLPGHNISQNGEPVHNVDAPKIEPDQSGQENLPQENDIIIDTISQPSVIEQLTEEPYVSNPGPPVVQNPTIEQFTFRVSWSSIFRVICFVTSGLFLTEAVLALNQFLIAAWCCVWYFSAPDLAGRRDVAWSDIRAATLRIFTAHLGSVALVAALNIPYAFLRFLKVPYFLVMFCPPLMRFKKKIGETYPKFSSAFHLLDVSLETVSETTISECLLHGIDLVTAAGRIVERHYKDKAVTRLLKFGGTLTFIGVVWIGTPLAGAIAVLAARHFGIVESPPTVLIVTMLVAYYVSSVFGSSISQSTETITSCYRLERQDKSNSLICTPDQLNVTASEIHTAAIRIILEEGDAEADDSGSYLALRPINNQVNFALEVSTGATLDSRVNPSSSLESTFLTRSPWLDNPIQPVPPPAEEVIAEIKHLSENGGLRID